MKIENDIDNSNAVSNELVTENQQNKFMETALGKTINGAIDIGLRWILPDLVEDEIIKIKDGLIQEVEKVYKYKDTKSLQTGIGYKEVIKYLDKEITLEECSDLIKKNSRHYAKRQYTFLKHQLPVTWFNVNYDNFNDTILQVKEYILNFCKK